MHNTFTNWLSGAVSLTNNKLMDRLTDCEGRSSFGASRVIRRHISALMQLQVVSSSNDIWLHPANSCGGTRRALVGLRSYFLRLFLAVLFAALRFNFCRLLVLFSIVSHFGGDKKQPSLTSVSQDANQVYLYGMVYCVLYYHFTINCLNHIQDCWSRIKIRLRYRWRAVVCAEPSNSTFSSWSYHSTSRGVTDVFSFISDCWVDRLIPLSVV